MSIPRNHHYISQVHIKHFFNEIGEIYLYNKTSELYQIKKSSKRIFSEKDLNTIFYHNANDYDLIEGELNEFFEKDFDLHFGNIENLLIDKEVSLDVQKSILYLARYGAIAILRTPNYKKKLTNEFLDIFQSITKISDEKLESSFNNFFDIKGDSKYLHSGSLLETGNNTILKMGLIYFTIEVPENEDDYFFLPDFGASTIRDFNVPNFDPYPKEISYIGLPLSSKIYIHFYSERTLEQNCKFGKINSNQVYQLNKANYDYANEIVACENLTYLENFIKKNLRLT